VSTSVSFNGGTYTLPSTNETGWGANVTAFLTAVAGNALAKSGGAFTLTAEVDFGATYGVKAAYFKTKGTNIAAAGAFRLARNETVSWRNEANGADLALGPGSDNVLEFNGVDVVTTTGSQTITNKKLSTNTGVLAAYSRATAQTLTNNVDTLIDFPTVIHDTASAVTTGASWKFTVPAGQGGYYRVTALVSIVGTITVDCRINIYKNGAGAGAMSIDNRAQASNSAYGGSRTLLLADGDYIDIRAYQSSGADRQTIADANFNHVFIERIPG
jgi:hypothetical protein